PAVHRGLAAAGRAGVLALADRGLALRAAAVRRVPPPLALDAPAAALEAPLPVRRVRARRPRPPRARRARRRPISAPVPPIAIARSTRRNSASGTSTAMASWTP